MRRWVIAASLLLLGACSSCESDRTVPFGLDGPEPPDTEVETETATPVERPSGRAMPDGTTRVDLQGAPITMEGSIRSLWADDVDEDGDRDAVVVVSGGPERPVSLHFVRREGAAFLPPRELGHAPAAPEGCVIDSATVEPISERWLEARVELACPDAPASSRTELFVISIERTPRVLEHLAILSEVHREPGEMSVGFEVVNPDEDGHDDLAVDFSLGDNPRRRARVVWLDRPSGLARDAAEPANLLNERSREALRLLRTERDDALAQSRDVLALHRALCGETRRARIRIGETEGLSCGESEGAGRAATTVIRALAARGDLLQAVEAYAHLEDPGQRITEERRTYARAAIAAAPAVEGVTLREGPAFTAPSSSHARLSALGFLDEHRILMRGLSAMVYDIETGELTAADTRQGDVRILDPSDTYAAVAIQRSCAGYELSIMRASSVVGQTQVGPVAGSPLVEAVDAPDAESCTELPADLRADDGGWTILGWAPQGVLVAQADRLRIVPLDVAAQPTGDPQELERGTPPPAPLKPGIASANARFWTEIRGLGVIVHDTGRARSQALFWPEGWAEREGDPTHAAVSPSGRRVAVARGGAVLILERAE